ncbi:DNA -binding domain-containing protein [Bradyrhizobium sp. USDA 223]|uniref:DNA -binding domain-containing protein n=1 Tax=Bradyrhizobium sp. USDA 223 TaxID=3156306 RepID=UPI00384BF68D
MAPSVDEVTSYDKEHVVAYMRLLDADAEKADWREIARIVLGLDPTVGPDRARRTFESHLARAKWLAGHGYRDLLRSGWPKQ